MALFQPFRALGYITDDVPFAVQRRGRETYVTVSVGKAWQVYNTAKLTLVFVGPQLKYDIGALACKGDLTFAAVRGTIVECRRMHRSGEYRGHNADIIQLLVLGDRLLSLGRDGKLLVWRIGEYDAPEVSITLPPSFTPSCLCHPDTYLNKVVVGSEQGSLQLWNFSTGRMLYEFKGFGSGVRCLEASPALDVVGVGLADGRAVLHNLRFDETLAQFANASGVGTNADLFLTGSAAQAARLAAAGACTAISFRTGNGVPLMAAGGGAGVVTVWDLEQRKLHTVIRDAHDAPIVQLHFFAGEPLLMSAGAENSLKHWLFDAVDGSSRLLRFRSGHAAPPTVVRHYGPDGRRLLSAGQDRAFRCFSTIQDQQSRELSQRHTARRAKRLKVSETELKLARVVALDACEVRERDWSNVLTAHEGDTAAYVWRLQHYSIGEHVLKPPGKEQGEAPAAPVTAVCVSRCGNFGFVGTAGGRLDRYNMQSGLHRGVYARPGSSPPTAHQGAVYGVCSDGCNRWVASGGYDGVLRVWDFKKRTLLGEVQVGVPIARICHHPSTGLLAAACDDLVIRMFDVEALRLVRRFSGHTDRISDLQLSSDCRWLISSSLDNTVRVWDVPGARVLQVMRLGSPVTSLSLSPATDLLATTHVEHRGVYLWANQLLFGAGGEVLASERPVDVRLPSLSSGQSAAGKGGPPAADAPEHDLQQLLGRTAAAAAAAATAGEEKAGQGVGSDEESDSIASLASSEDEEMSEGSSEESDSESDAEAAAQHGQQGVGVMEVDAAAAAAAAPYAARDAAGAPQPLLPQLVTLSMLPRTQWQNLAHLDTIRARSKPIEPPKKPEAAPFFLPTLAGVDAGRNPVFDLAGGGAAGTLQGGEQGDGALAAAAAAAWGGSGDEEEGEGEELKLDFGKGDSSESEGEEAGGSSSGEEDEEQPATAGKRQQQQGKPKGGSGRIVKTGGRGAAGGLLSLLRSCSKAGDWTSAVGYLRGLPPVQVESQIREMQVLEGASEEELLDLELLLEFLESEAASNRNFEFVQALLRVVLQVHGDSILRAPPLRQRAERIRQRLGASWRRVDDLLQGVRCMLGLLGNMQA